MFDYTEQERYVLNEILKMESENEPPFIEELKYCVENCVMDRFQTHMIAFALFNKKTLLSADTGLGKTVMAAGIINVISSKILGSKWVIVCPLFNMTQTINKLESMCYGKRFIGLSNAESDIEKVKKIGTHDWDVLVVSYQSLVNNEVQRFLLDNRMHLTGIIVDESQMVANLEGSASVLLYSMCNALEFATLLTATPIRVNVGQFIKQIMMLNRDLVPKGVSTAVRRYTHYDENGKAIGVRNLDDLLDLVKNHYISYTRQELGYKGEYNVEPIIVPNKYLYKDVERKDIFRKIKGDMSSPALKTLVKTIYEKKAENKKGLIYINLNDNKKNIKNYLIQCGLKVDILDGSVTNTKVKKEKVKQAFLDGKLDCLITNLTMGLDLPCEYILFYELTFDFKQFLGRGERGLKANNLDVIFIIVENTEEVSYFYENVYARAKLLGLVCGKDVSELQLAYNQFCRGMRKKSLKIE